MSKRYTLTETDAKGTTEIVHVFPTKKLAVAAAVIMSEKFYHLPFSETNKRQLNKDLFTSLEGDGVTIKYVIVIEERKDENYYPEYNPIKYRETLGHRFTHFDVRYRNIESFRYYVHRLYGGMFYSNAMFALNRVAIVLCELIRQHDSNFSRTEYFQTSNYESSDSKLNGLLNEVYLLDKYLVYVYAMRGSMAMDVSELRTLILRTLILTLFCNGFERVNFFALTKQTIESNLHNFPRSVIEFVNSEMLLRIANSVLFGMRKRLGYVPKVEVNYLSYWSVWQYLLEINYVLLEYEYYLVLHDAAELDESPELASNEKFMWPINMKRRIVGLPKYKHSDDTPVQPVQKKTSEYMYGTLICDGIIHNYRLPLGTTFTHAKREADNRSFCVSYLGEISPETCLYNFQIVEQGDTVPIAEKSLVAVLECTNETHKYSSVVITYGTEGDDNV